MTTSLWMTPQQVAEESGRHYRNVVTALRRGLLRGTQASPKSRWQVSRKAFNVWMEAGRPIEKKN